MTLVAYGLKDKLKLSAKYCRNFKTKARKVYLEILAARGISWTGRILKCPFRPQKLLFLNFIEINTFRVTSNTNKFISK